MYRLTLIARDGDLYTPESAIVCEDLRKHYKGDEVCIMLHRYSAGDVDTIAWPAPNEEQLRSCLYDLRETGMIPADTKSVELPDGSVFEIEQPMTNADLLAAMQSSGRLIVGHVGDSAPKGTIVYRLPATVVLKSRRFAQVIDNELHVRKYEDPSHGWLAVPMQWIKQLGITSRISSCSYLRGETAYLEEDCDAPEFRKAAEAAGFKLFVDYRHTNDSSPIRSYPSFP
jgi:hypothetical protein